MKQNVSAITAAIIIFVAIAVFFVAFSNRQPPPDVPSVPVPQVPEVPDNQVADMYKGLSPLGVVTVMPPLPEDRNAGMRVCAVLPNSPAQRAGVQPVDLITSFNGKKLASKDALIFLLTQVDPKRTYPIVVDRNGKQLTLNATGLVPLPPEERVGM